MLTPNSYNEPLIRLGELIRPEVPVFVDTKIMRSDAVNGLVATEPVTVGYCSQHVLEAWNKISPELIKSWLASNSAKDRFIGEFMAQELSPVYYEEYLGRKAQKLARRKSI